MEQGNPLRIEPPADDRGPWALYHQRLPYDERGAEWVGGFAMSFPTEQLAHRAGLFIRGNEDRMDETALYHATREFCGKVS